MAHTKTAESMIDAKTMLLMLGMFGVLYLEPIVIAGAKWSHIWKAIAVAFLIAYIATKPMQQGSTLRLGSCEGRRLFIWWLGYSIVALFSLPLSENAATTVTTIGQRLLPLLVGVGLVHSSINVVSLLKKMVIFIAVSGLPFVFGLTPQIGKAYDLSHVYGYEVIGLSGVFQNAHAAGISFALAALGAYAFRFRATSRRDGLFWLIVLLVLVLELSMTNARGPLLAFAVGAGFFSLRYLSVRKYLPLAVGGVVIVASIMAGVSDIEGVKNRIMGTTVYHSGYEYNIHTATSGRTLIWAAAASVFVDAGPLGWLVGVSHDRIPELLSAKGLPPLVTHNGFLGELLGNGLIGFILMIGFSWRLYRCASVIDDYNLRGFYQAAILAFVTFGFFQSYDYPVQMMIFSLVLPLASRRRTLTKNRLYGRFRQV